MRIIAAGAFGNVENPVRAGLVGPAQDWRLSSVNDYSGVSATQQMRRCGLTIDRVGLPLDSQARI